MPVLLNTKAIANRVIVSVAAGYNHSLALTQNGMVLTWGRGNFGELGDNMLAVHSRPFPRLINRAVIFPYLVISIGTVGTIAGYATSYAVTDAGKVYVWGSNSIGEFGNSVTAIGLYASLPKLMTITPLPNTSATAFTSSWTASPGISLNVTSTFANQTLYSFGQNTYGHFASGTAAAATVAGMTKIVAPFSNASIVTASLSYHALYVFTGITCFGIFADDVNVCTGHGSCVAPDTCVCKANYVDVDCSIPMCFGKNGSDPDVCSGKGHCVTLDTCACFRGYVGATCSSIYSGIVYATGTNNYGQLGDGYMFAQNLFVSKANIFVGIQAVAVSAGDKFSLVLSSDGTVYSAGSNTRGQLGDGTTVNKNQTNTIVLGLIGQKIIDISAGQIHCLAISDTGMLFSWGGNTKGQLGIGTTVDSLTAVQVTGDIGNSSVVQVATGREFSVVLTRNGTVFTFGENGQYQLGDNTAVSKTVPTQVYLTGLIYRKRVVQIAAGSIHVTVLTTDGIVYAWGNNDNNNLGTGNTVTAPTAVLLAGALTGKVIVKISSGSGSNLALDNTGNVYAWGHNAYGQLGSGATTVLTTPTKVMSNMTAIFAGTATITTGFTSASFGINYLGRILAWGYGILLGVGKDSTSNVLSPTAFNSRYPNRTVYDINSFETHTLAIYQNTTTCNNYLYDEPEVCNFHGDCVGVDTCSCYPGYTGDTCNEYMCNGISAADSSVCSSNGTCIASNTCVCNAGYIGTNCEQQVYGALYGVGRNLNAELGDDNLVQTNSLVKTSGYLFDTPVVQIAAGYYSSIALTPDGTVYVWGSNANSQIVYNAAGAQTVRHRPLPLVYNMTYIYGAEYATYALTNSTRLWAWGRVTNGQGMSESVVAAPYTFPILSALAAPVRKIQSGTGFVVVLTNDGVIYSWGTNTNGETGQCTTATTVSSNPVQPVKGILALRKFVDISCGTAHCLALSTNADIYSWGLNADGQLGDGSTITKICGIQVIQTVLYHVVILAVRATQASSYALSSSGNVYVWGKNDVGQLGINSIVSQSNPVQVNITNVISLEVSKIIPDANAYPHVLALTSNGVGYGWGSCTYGECGDSGTAQKNKPSQWTLTLPTGSSVVSMAPGAYHSLFILNGTFCYGLLSSSYAVCSNRGVCVATDTCICNNGYYGDKCDSTMCFGVSSNDTSVCSGSGACVDIDTCVCTSGVIGKQCNITVNGYVWSIGDNTVYELGDDLSGLTSSITRYPAAYPLSPGIYISQVICGLDNTFVITTAGDVYVWGSNLYGISGAGDPASVGSSLSTPTKLTTQAPIAGLSSNKYHTAFVDLRGRLWTVGGGSVGNGLLGNTSYPLFTYVPIIVGYNLNSTNVTQVSAGLYHSVVLTSTGIVYSFGRNVEGQIGDGTTVNALVPTLTGTTTEFGGFLRNRRAIAVQAGDYHTLILLDRGDIFLVGANTNGQLGDGSVNTKKHPRQLLGLLYNNSAIAIGAGLGTSYAVTGDGRAFSWGATTNGALGINVVTGNQLTPVPMAGISTAVSIRASVAASVVMITTSSNTVYGAGINTQGMIGDGTTTQRNVSVLSANSYPIRYTVAAAASVRHSAFLMDGMRCFGLFADDPIVCGLQGTCIAQNTCVCNSGYTGANCTIPICNNILSNDTAVCSGNGRCMLPDFCDCYAGYAGTYCDARSTSYFLFSVGTSANNALGDGVYVVNRYVPAIASTLYKQRFHFVISGEAYSVAFNLETNVTVGWGANSNGELALSHFNSPVVYPTRTWIGYSPIKMCAGTHTMLLDRNNKIWTVGRNNYGQIGNNVAGNINTPFQVSTMIPGNESYVDIGCSFWNSAAVTASGVVYIWGYNDAGNQLARTAFTVNFNGLPSRMVGAIGNKRVVRIRPGYSTTVAICDDGTIWAVGNNAMGQIGDGTLLTRTKAIETAISLRGIPVVDYGSDYIPHNQYFTLRNGSVAAWGLGGTYGFPDAATADRPKPVILSLIPYPVTRVKCGWYTCYALTNATYNITGWAYVADHLGDGTSGPVRNRPSLIANMNANRYVADAAPGYNGNTILLLKSRSCFGYVFDDIYVCSMRGTCVDEDTCSCLPNYYGSDCSIKSCFGINSTDTTVCSGNGACLAYNTCSCRLGYSGSDCSVPNTGYIVSAGDDTYYQLGDNNVNVVGQSKYIQPDPLALLAKRVFLVGAGAKYTLFLTTGNELFGMGLNQYGILGSSSISNSTGMFITPLFPQFWGTIKSMVAGTYIAMMLDTNGQLYTWGTPAGVGQLGLGSTTTVKVPTLVNVTSNDTISSYSCGLTHTVVSTATTGTVYAWGQNNLGQVGGLFFVF